MATVRLTQDAKNQLQNAASYLYVKRISDAQKIDEDLVALATKVLDYWLDRQPWGGAWRSIPLDALPADRWLSIHRINNWEVDRTVCLPHPIPVPARLVGRSAAGCIVDDPAWQEIADAGIARAQERSRLTAERNSFCSKVDAFLRRHSTLKAALAEWPQLWEIVPQDMRDRHNALVEKSLPKKIERQERFDTTALTGAIVTAKIMASIIKD